ncbi:MAG: hypothetical protein SCALA701_11040 [Candidatus Scalindua sp.]|nr:MAG: hypothetical protein SCALA701_11040 [Candidatus Scalindua sp.]
MENIWLIISKPDNVPIVGLILLIVLFTWMSFSQARKNDRQSNDD